MGTWHYIVTLLALAAMGTMFVIFNQILTNNIYQDITLNTNNSQYNFSTDDQQQATDFLAFWAVVPWVLALVALTFLFMRSWQVQQ
jgi:hypothetical protein